MREWYVVYTVEGYGERHAGPYTFDEARAQRDDIEGYEAVSNVTIKKRQQLGHLIGPMAGDW